VLLLDILAIVWVHGAHHTVVQARAGCGAVEENGICVIDENAIRRRVFEHLINGVKAAKETRFRGSGHLVGYAWHEVFGADD